MAKKKSPSIPDREMVRGRESLLWRIRETTNFSRKPPGDGRSLHREGWRSSLRQNWVGEERKGKLNILHNQGEHMFFQGYCQWNLISFRTRTQSFWGFSLPPSSTHSHQTISLFPAQIPGRYPGDRHQRNESRQPRTGHAVRGRLGTTWKAEDSWGVLLLLLWLFFKELWNVFRLSFSLRTATSGGTALKSQSPEQPSAAGQGVEEGAAPSGEQKDPHRLRG